MGRARPAANTSTGEYLQLELLDKDDKAFSWSGGGRHVNASKKLGAALYKKDSGYTKNDKLVWSYYLFHSPPGDEPLRESFREIGINLELRPNAVSTSVGNLHRGGYLLEAETVGRVKFYKMNPRAAYDGTSGQQRNATQHARHPSTTCPPAKKKEAS
ncbi:MULTISPECIES: transcriptional regulator [unclassified Streptomyces]|uniref:transcriptional regulator n=1 Tax=Streptomyces TaxID=1883 RepID=UPI00190C2011|nr:transcriptional regulator [Streptomyces sp. MBT62]MBK3568958.1 transcriptional regulator [Streptomyces sp. MBT62]